MILVTIYILKPTYCHQCFHRDSKSIDVCMLIIYAQIHI